MHCLKDLMNIEFEAKFYPIDKDLIRTTLQQAGATLIKPEMRMRRVVYKLGALDSHQWLRIRDEGDKVTITFKEVIDESIEGVREIEIIASSFDDSRKLLSAIGFEPRAYQETDRETWQLNGGMITIDTWPCLEPFLEVEGDSEQHVKDLSHKLGLDYDKAYFGSVEVLYRKKYGITLEELNKIANLTFDLKTLK